MDDRHIHSNCCSEDDEDEEVNGEQEQENTPEAVSEDQPMEENDDEEAPVKTEDGVKPEPKAQSTARKAKAQATPSGELHVYSTDELKKYKKDELLADVAYLDGKCIVLI